MDDLWRDFTARNDPLLLLQASVRLLAAVVLGAIVGLERERLHRAAGLRTHVLVCLGAALVTILAEQMGMAGEALSRVFQGILTGIGFIGAGTIMKGGSEDQIQGLTTAASIWVTSALGMAAGIGRFGLAFVSVFLALIVLLVLPRVEARVR